MLLLIVVIRKILNNKWLVACLTLGLILAVALVSSVPIYSGGVLQKMLTSELESYQASSNKYPGDYQVVVSFKPDIGEIEKKDVYQRLNRYITKKIVSDLGLAPQVFVTNASSDVYKLEPANPSKADPSIKRFARLQSLSDIEEHIKIVDGRLPSKDVYNGIYEVLATEAAMRKLDVVLGETFIMDFPGSDKNIPDIPIKVKLVGVFAPKYQRDLYWFKNISSYSDSLLLDHQLFVKEFIEHNKLVVKNIEWYYALDYHKIKVQNIGSLIKAHNRINKELNELYKGFNVNAPMIGIVSKYSVQANRISTLLWALNMPVLLLLCFYLLMVSSMVIDNDRGEMAVLNSRGADRIQVMSEYIVEGALLSVFAVIIAPVVGLVSARMMGMSGGFLEFVNRKALPVTLSRSAYQLSIIAAIIFLIALLTLSYTISKTTIISFKTQLARRNNVPWWKRWYVDFILLLLAVYCLYLFNQQQQIIMRLGNVMGLQSNQLLFVASTIFILGAGLFILRIYPLLLNIIYKLGMKWWPSFLYAALIRVSRSMTSYQFIMIFLILTISTGIFGANTARTLNRNIEDEIYYHIGCDVALRPIWDNDAPAVSAPPQLHLDLPSQVSNAEKREELTQEQAVHYFEPPFVVYQSLNGVEHAAKVFIKDMVDVDVAGKRGSGVQLIAIEPYEFGQVLWFRSDLLWPHHINEYLNLLSYEPSAILVSRSFSDEYGVEKGDTLRMSWRGVEGANFIVYEIVDYWPGWDPHKGLAYHSISDEGKKNPMLIVANLPYIQNHLALEPYEVWLKMKTAAASQALYEDIKDKGIAISDIRDANQEIIKSKKEPSQMGVNGALTLGFIISLIITFLGFLIYCLLFMRNRLFEFGVFRAMGMPLIQIVGMVIFEQLLTSGASLIIGISVGNIASRLFIPILQTVYGNHIPPFQVIADVNDYLKVYFAMGVILLAGFVVMWRTLKGVKIGQAIKMGEE
ncbi:ABC transporter permease [Mahella australiensis]|uniref:ABC3 transporter permease C-terminal domain-containing protein n=1 Tax=Mahella australiensis (strain DSM 15567 / CIP 107919 / 50-1 BON) TaxID=697281 RepID=F4A0T7_MAHA5|nr:ABC transporter permease [Mahella australiensis]AEE96983.1 protein of unknown function DUF214 [Mahella australiensis 50-1 BON]